MGAVRPGVGPAQVRDLGQEHPERVAELAAAWDDGAWENQVYPLDEGTGYRYVVRPPSTSATTPVRDPRRHPHLERYRSQLLIQWRDVDVTPR